MNTTFVRHSTSDNLLLEGLLSVPSSPTTTAVLFIHGRGGNFYQDGFIDTLRTKCTKKGYAFLSVNTRGHDIISFISIANGADKNKKAGSAFEIFDESRLDIAAWIDFLVGKKYTKIILVGHSLGASKVVYYIAKTKDKRVSHMVCMSPVPLVILKGTPGFEELMKIAKAMIKEKKADELLPKKVIGNYMSPQTFLHYVTNTKAHNIFNLYDTTKPSLLLQVTIPLLAVYGNEDEYKQYFPIEKLLKYIKEKASYSKVTTQIINGAGHSYANFEEDLARIILNWIKK